MSSFYNFSSNQFFIGTTFDGLTVFNMLKDIEENGSISRNVDKITIWKITKKYNEQEFIPGKIYPIEVYFGSIGKTNTEYLVNFDYIVEKLKENSIELVTDDIAKQIGFEKASNTFDKLFKIIVKDKKKNYSKMSDIEKEYSALNRWFIFQKQ